MAVPQIEQRVAVLEEEVARLKAKLEKAVPSRGDWLNDIYGAFADDPHFEEAMRLGRKYRESLRPKPTKEVPRPKAKKAAKSRQR